MPGELEGLEAALAGAQRRLAVSVRPGAGIELAADGRTWSVDTADPAAVAAQIEVDHGPRWVWWSAAAAAPTLVAGGLTLASCWDVAAVHRLVHGGGADRPSQVWAAIRGLDWAGRPRLGQLDLLGLDGGPSPGHAGPAGEDDPDSPVLATGYLRPECDETGWVQTAARSRRWAALALDVAREQEQALAQVRPEPATESPGDARVTARAESGAALLCVELERDGLPIDRVEIERLLMETVGPPPATEAERVAGRRRRDAAVLDLVPGDASDLRNPAQVRDLLARVGIQVPDTRSWRLEPYADVHPVVPALLAWRKAERIETTYGYSWLERSLGQDGRLRGAWAASDGAAGRMTAQAGLHNLPAELRGAVAADEGWTLVRADLGQIEPRVLAAVSGDRGLTAATVDDDLYTPVAARLAVDRPTAKVAVLAAMYGQTSGSAGRALEGMQASYPTAIGYLERADQAGRAAQPVRTYGGRRVPVWETSPDLDAGAARAMANARGRFTRNAVVQGAAAELFKAWAATARLELRSLDARIVLCLHDELLVHVRQDRAAEAEAVLHRTLGQTARWWFPGGRTRFVAQVSAGRRWTDAKVS